MLLSDLFLQFARTNRKIRSPQTIKLYVLSIKQLGHALGHVPTIDDLSDESIVALEKYLESDARSPYTVNERCGRIKSVWRYAARKGLVNVWPTIANVDEPPPYTRAWDVPQLRAIIAACEKMPGNYGGVAACVWWRVWHVVQFSTGERTGAMLALRWDWITARGLDVPGSVRKDKKPAFYFLSQSVRAELKTMRHPRRDLVFAWPYHFGTFYNHYKRLLQIACLPTDRKSKPQRIRRSHLTWWHLGGENATERAQHVDPATTAKHYLDRTLFPQVDPSTVLPDITGKAAS